MSGMTAPEDWREKFKIRAACAAEKSGISNDFTRKQPMNAGRHMTGIPPQTRLSMLAGCISDAGIDPIPSFIF